MPTPQELEETSGFQCKFGYGDSGEEAIELLRSKIGQEVASKLTFSVEKKGTLMNVFGERSILLEDVVKVKGILTLSEFDFAEQTINELIKEKEKKSRVTQS